jgi:thioredoxin-related protein
MKYLCALALLILLGCQFSIAQNESNIDAKSATVAPDTYIPVNKFDPKRDAAADIHAAIAEAQKTGKRIILDIGGDWCQYCHQMDKFFDEHPDVLQIREKNFITLAIFYSSDHKNEDALSRYSPVLGIPSLFCAGKGWEFAPFAAPQRTACKWKLRCRQDEEFSY